MGRTVSRVLRKDELVIEKGRRADSPFWQARIKLEGKWKTYSTKKEDEGDAVNWAQDLWSDCRAAKRLDLPLPVGGVTFKKVAEEVLVGLRADIAAGHRRSSTFKKFLTCIENQLIPALGKVAIDGVTSEVLEGYTKGRTGRSGNAPMRGTIRNHNHALQHVLKYAVKKKYLDQTKVAAMDMAEYEEGDPRATFTLSEFERLKAYLPGWVPNGRKQVTREINAVLREYILILAATGIRPGTEAASIRWRHIERRTLRSKAVVYYIYITKEGKTRKRRTVVAPSLIADSLDRLRDLNGGTTDPDALLFKVPSTGRLPRDIQGAFERLMRDSDLMFDGIFKEKRTPYSIRHFYVTQMRLRGHSYETLAKQCGTSVLMLEKYYDKVQPEMEAERLVADDLDALRQIVIEHNDPFIFTPASTYDPSITIR